MFNLFFCLGTVLHSGRDNETLHYHLTETQFFDFASQYLQLQLVEHVERGGTIV